MHETLSQQLLISKRANLSCEAIQIPFKIDRGPVFSNRERCEIPIVTIYGLQMTKATGDISVIVSGLDRCYRCKTIYRTLNVAGQNDHGFNEKFMKDASLQHVRDMAVCCNGVCRGVRQEKGQG